MAVAELSRVRTGGLPEELRVAQAAIRLPAVQEMLRRLAAHNLGICMPHMHDERTGAFLPLPDSLRQVESGLEVTFASAEDIEDRAEHYIPTGWRWRDGENPASPMAYCHTVCAKQGDDTMHYSKHES